jgi:hypothetical protein
VDEVSKDKRGSSIPRAAAVGAVIFGLAAGSYGIASAASGSGSAAAGGSNSAATPTAAPTARSAPNPGNPWGVRRSDETLLTGDTAAKVRQVALAKVGNATIVRVETDADGHAAYEAHMIKADGTPVTVYIDKQFNVVGVESR